MTILEKLADYAKLRVVSAKEKLSYEELRSTALSVPKGSFEFENALKKPDISFICECKKASPSKGIIAEDFPYLRIAEDYESAGADCISVLTEPKWFLGSNEYLREIAEKVSVPCIRKDFTVDDYMIYEAKLLGAKAVLLICSILTAEQIRAYIKVCDSLGMSALVEAHNEAEVKTAVNCGARLIGVNNRNLSDFSVDTENSRRLRELVPHDVLFVSESGVKTAEDIALLREAGADAVLIGETLMRAEDKSAKLAELRGYNIANTKVKMCGLRRETDIEYANKLLPHYVGYVFARKSKRYISPEQASKLTRLLDERITPVGVFVDEPIENVIGLVKSGTIKAVQLHGNENEEYVARLKKEDIFVIKAFIVRSESDILRANDSPADLVLLDAGMGDGKQFDYRLLGGMKRKYFLAGGLDKNNVNDAIRKLAPYAVDVSSGIETDGVKDFDKMKEFMDSIY